MTDTYAALFRHMEWADAAVWSSIGAHDAARDDAQLRDLLYHLHMVQHAFLRVWNGETERREFEKFADTPGIMKWARDFHARALPDVEAMDLSQPLPVPWAALVERKFGHAPAMTSAGETVTQVVLHTTYHRGQVNSRLRAVGGEPPLVDFIAWVWLGKPGAEWPST